MNTLRSNPEITYSEFNNKIDAFEADAMDFARGSKKDLV